jgi:Actin like proteins N terminal domain/Archaeal actin homologue MreB-like, C-terminal
MEETRETVYKAEGVEGYEETIEGEMNPSVCAIDVGRSNTKVMAKGRKEKFPSVYGHPLNSFVFDAGLSVDSSRRVLEFEGEKYLTGEDAVRLKDFSFLSDVDSIIKYSPLFIARAVGERKVNTLCLGLPLADFARYKGDLKARCRKFRVNGKEYSFDKVIIYAQGTGVLFEHLQKYPRDRNIIIAEIGFFTLDCIAVENQVVSDSDFRDDRGINELCKKLHAWIYNAIGVDCSLVKVQEILQERSLACVANRYQKMDGDLEKAVVQLKTRYTNEIIQHIKQRFGQSIKVMDRIVLAGGGANYIREDLIPADLQDLVHIVKEPEFANARGWFMSASSGQKKGK